MLALRNFRSEISILLFIYHCFIVELAMGALGDVITNFPDPINFKAMDISERNDTNTSYEYETGDGYVIPDHLLDPVMYKWFPSHDFPPTDPPAVPEETPVLSRQMSNTSATEYSQIESNDSLNHENHSNTESKPTQLAVLIEQFSEVPEEEGFRDDDRHVQKTIKSRHKREVQRFAKRNWATNKPRASARPWSRKPTTVPSPNTQRPRKPETPKATQMSITKTPIMNASQKTTLHTPKSTLSPKRQNGARNSLNRFNAIQRLPVTPRKSSSPQTLTVVRPDLNRKGLIKATTLKRSAPQYDALTTQLRIRTTYSKWNMWMKCSSSDCDKAGRQLRTRSCFADNLTGANFEKCSYRNLVEERPCKPKLCPTKPSKTITSTSKWSTWSSCSVTCGLGGAQSRRKTCFKAIGDGSQQNSVVRCSGISFQRRPCRYSVGCPLWDTWGSWSKCSKTCGTDGVAFRTRNCIVKRYITFDLNGVEDAVDSSLDPTTMQNPNIVNKNAGGLNQGIHPSQPELLTGKLVNSPSGKQIFLVDAPTWYYERFPLKISPPQFHQLKPVTEFVDASACAEIGGASEEERKCELDGCPASWTMWANWSPCTTSCGMGISRRQRTCEGDSSGDSCIGKKYAYRRCYTPPCWDSWQSWTSCSATCMSPGAVRERTRRCIGRTSVIPQYTKCEGEATEVGECKIGWCPGKEWGNWGAFGECSASCNGGFRNRTRLCQASTCSGPSIDSVKCNDHECPSWSQWTFFSCCSVTCGMGRRKRSRVCLSGVSEITGCDGNSVDYEPCYKRLCNAPKASSMFTGFRCGVGSPANLKSIARLRIFGGKKSGAHDWPWQVSWQHREGRTSDWLHFCGATLIHPRWVVTASHCTEETDYVMNHVNPGENWSVVVGMVMLYEDGTRYFTERVFVHPRYQYKSVTRNDIALIKLRRMVPITNTVMPACMPRNKRPTPGTECYVTGWGYTSGDESASLSLSLREAAVPIIRFGQCRNLGEYYRYFLDSRIHMCAGNPITASSDSCTGDSGGPLVCQRNRRWYIGAVTSFGFADCGTPGHVGIYAPVDTYETWIRMTLNAHTYERC